MRFNFFIFDPLVKDLPERLGYFIPWCYSRQRRKILCMAKPSPKHAGDKALVALGDAIRLARAQAGISQEELAVTAEADRSYMGGIERGEHNLTFMNLKRIAEALDLKPSALLISAGL
jgi:ribosome-binding protein aMBF1 (putative translation factor)